MDHFLVDYENIGEAGLKGIENLGDDTATVIFYSEHADKISFDMHQKLSRCRSKLEFRKAETGKKNALDFQLSTYLGYLVASHQQDRFFIISKDNGYRVVMDFWNRSNIEQLDYIGRAYEKPVRAAADQTKPSQPAPLADRKPEVTDRKPEAADRKHEAADRKPEVTDRKPEVSEKTPGTPQNGQEEKQPALPAEEKEGTPAHEDTLPETEKRPRRGGRRRNPGTKETPADEKPSEELMNALAQLIDSEEERENIGRFIVKYKTKQGVNNAIVKIYGTEKAGELYKKIKPLLKDKKGK